MAKDRYEFDMTARERRKKEWENAKKLSGAKKAGHIWRYYKIQIIIIVLAVLAVIFAVHQAYCHLARCAGSLSC